MDDVEGKVTEAPLRFHYDNFYIENRQIRHVYDARTQGIQIHTILASCSCQAFGSFLSC